MGGDHRRISERRRAPIPRLSATRFRPEREQRDEGDRAGLGERAAAVEIGEMIGRRHVEQGGGERMVGPALRPAIHRRARRREGEAEGGDDRGIGRKPRACPNLSGVKLARWGVPGSASHFGVAGHGEAVQAVGDDAKPGGDQQCRAEGLGPKCFQRAVDAGRVSGSVRLTATTTSTPPRRGRVPSRCNRRCPVVAQGAVPALEVIKEVWLTPLKT